MACNIFLDLPNGVKMPALGFGTWQSVDDSLENALEVALEAGYRHIDTAQAYGNEEIIGKVLKKWFDAGKLKREDVFITTKLAATSLYPAKVEGCTIESLKKLQLEYVDLYLMHFPVTIAYKDEVAYGDPNVSYLDVWQKMEEQFDAGRAKSIGISNFNIRQVHDVLKNARIKPANLQIELHVYMQQRDLVNCCKKHGITVVAYSPLGCRGYNQFLAKWGKEAKELPDLFLNPAVQTLSQKHSKTPAQVLLRYLLQIGVSPIPKSVTPSRIIENIDVFDFALDENDMKVLYDLEVGPSVRICDFKVFGMLCEHPNFPF